MNSYEIIPRYILSLKNSKDYENSIKVIEICQTRIKEQKSFFETNEHYYIIVTLGKEGFLI